MNKRLVFRLLSAIVLLEAACMVPSLLLSLLYRDGDAPALLLPMLVMTAAALPVFLLVKPADTNMRAREGFFVVGFSWIVLSVLGAVPFWASGMIPNFLDAVFESVSGFTTTGATVLRDFDGLPRGVMFWRAFTHWIGGMGVLVLTMALMPRLTGRTSFLIRAESPGPSLSKIVPKMGDSAKILYVIYTVLTLAEAAALMLAGLTPYDAFLHAMSTAGTGGFSSYAASIGAFRSPAVEWIITLFMVLYGVNFTVYYQLITRHWKDAVRSEELRLYAGVWLAAALACALMLSPQARSFGDALREGAFQCASFISTTGFATANVNAWPQGAQAVLVLLMVTGACAGSTAGGMKMVRIAVLWKVGRRETRHTIQPRKVQAIRFEGKAVEESLVSQICVFAAVYLMLVFLGTLLISLENRYDFTTNFTASLSSISNIGPVLSPASIADMSGFGPLAKVVMCMLMLCGRLELFPILVLFHPAMWKKV